VSSFLFLIDVQQERVAISELSRVLYEATSLKSLLRKI